MKADDILTNVETKHERVSPHIRECADVFHDNEGELFTRSEATDLLTGEVDITEAIAGEVIAELVSDIVDPVVQIVDRGEKYIGVIEFREFNGAYGYIDYHDVRGDDKRVVCQQCVNEASFDTEVAHATAGDPSGTVASGADYDELLEVVHQHYEDSHYVVPEDVETGATLASGTTIGGNTAFHEGNLDPNPSEILTSIVRAEDVNIHGKTLEAGDSITLSPDEGAVFSENYTVNGTLTIEDGGSITVV